MTSEFVIVIIVQCFFLSLIFGYVSSDFGSVPTTVKTNENTTVLLPCYLDTSNYETKLKVKWYKDGEILADSGPPSRLLPDRFRLWGNGSLEVVRVQPPDTGEYMCEVIRPEPWGPVRQIHAIEVLHPPSIEVAPESGVLEVKLGEEVTMSCSGTGVPTPIITWRKNGKDMQLISNRNVLTFTASDRRLAGTYECIATNGVGESAIKQIRLKITYPPDLTTIKSWVHTAPGFRTQLECRVTSDPTSTIIWYKGENQVGYDHRVFQLIDDSKYTLVIKNVIRSDFGIYTCKAANDIGEETLEFQLSGVPNPAEFKKTDDKNINAKSSYTLIWEVDSFTPIIEYSLWFRPYNRSDKSLHRQDWTKLTIPTEHKSNHGHVYSKMYTIRGLKEKTVYEASLISRNRYGWSKANKILKFATGGAEFPNDVTTSTETETENILDNIIPSKMESNASLILSNLYRLLIIFLFILR